MYKNQITYLSNMEISKDVFWKSVWKIMHRYERTTVQNQNTNLSTHHSLI